MRNHNDKTRDMARSILPSTARAGSRERKKGSARRARSRNRARLARLASHVADADAFQEALGCYDLDDTGWDGMVEDRRGADKVAPLIRWAQARIARTPSLAQGDYRVRRSYFVAILRGTVVGRHAISHLDHLFGRENPWEFGRYPGEPTLAELRERRRTEARTEHARRERLLDQVLAGAGPRRLNRRIRALTPPVEELWTLNDRGERARYGTRGHDSWLFDGDRQRWLDTAAAGRTDCRAAQEIAFEALAQVHAEMYGWDT